MLPVHEALLDSSVLLHGGDDSSTGCLTTL